MAAAKPGISPFGRSSTATLREALVSFEVVVIVRSVDRGQVLEEVRSCVPVGSEDNLGKAVDRAKGQAIAALRTARREAANRSEAQAQYGGV